MSILVYDLEMPKEPDNMIEIAIFGDGKVLLTGKGCKNPEDGKFHYMSTNPEKFYYAIPAPLVDLREE